MSESKTDPAEPLLDFERLDVYRLACEFQSLAFRVAARARAVCRNELERASLSIVLNIAEGAGRRSAAEKARFYVIARGSATESAALLDVLALNGPSLERRCPRRASPAHPDRAHAFPSRCALDAARRDRRLTPRRFRFPFRLRFRFRFPVPSVHFRGDP
jgi:four helix bundle protein